MSDLVVATVISSTVALLVAIGGSLFYGRRLRLETAKEAHGELRAEQWQLYDSFRQFIEQIFASVQGGREFKVDTRAQEQVIELSTKLWLVGSPELLHAYNAWRSVADPKDTLVALADIVGAMRNDLAPSARRVTRRSILATTINDLDESKLRVTGLEQPAGYFASRGTWRWPIRRLFIRVSAAARARSTATNQSETGSPLDFNSSADHSGVQQTSGGSGSAPISGARAQAKGSRLERRRKRGRR